MEDMKMYNKFIIVFLFVLVLTSVGVSFPHRVQALAGYVCADGTDAIMYQEFDHTVAANFKCNDGSTPRVGDVNSTPNPTSCAGGRNVWDDDFIICLWRGFMASIGWLLIQIGVMVLTIAGTLFEFSINHLVVGFGDLVGSSVNVGINGGWTVFRDIANIVIIGMFVFTAISLILGITKFGDRRNLARVLIIAVLLNFSLLFTKMIIDASNFVAAQFYTNMVKPEDAGQGTVLTIPPDTGGVPGSGAGTVLGNPNGNILQSTGLADRFMQYLGIDGIGNSFDMLRKIMDGNQSAWIGLGYAILMLIFMLATALIFLYGSYLLISRAVIFIVLMITAAIAFASWLVPGDFVKLGWDRWWESLWHNAALAPVLMIFLWITVTISKNLSHFVITTWAPSSGTAGASGAPAVNATLGALAANGSADAAIAALVNFIIILGLLYASFRVSSMLSSKVAGFHLPILSPLAMGAGFLAAPALRGLFGGSAYRRMATTQEQIKSTRRDMSLTPEARGEKIGTLLKQLEKDKKSAGRTYNAMDTDLAKKITGAAGLRGVLAGQTKASGYADQVKARVETAEKAAAAAKITGEDKEAIRQEVEKNITTKRQPEYDTLKTTAAEAEKTRTVLTESLKNAQATQNEVQQKRDQRMEELQKAQAADMKNKMGDFREYQEKQTTIEQGNQEIKDLRAAGKTEASNTDDFRAIKEKIETAKKEAQDMENNNGALRTRLSEIREDHRDEIKNDTTLKQHVQTVEDTNKVVKSFRDRLNDADRSFADANKNLEKFNKELKNEVDAAAKTEHERAYQGSQLAAEDAARRTASLTRFTGLETSQTETVMKEVSAKFGKPKEKAAAESITSILKAEWKKEQAAKEEKK